jgi:hypothetical protein
MIYKVIYQKAKYYHKDEIEVAVSKILSEL